MKTQLRCSAALALFLAGVLVATGAAAAVEPASPASPVRGVLRRHPTNPRYFTDDTGRAVLLAGSHTWATLQDVGLPNEPAFGYAAYLDFMQQHGHNFMRLWSWEHPWRAPWTAEPITISPLPYERTGPGLAGDGRPKFDLDRWNEAYFARLRERIVAAGQHGVYCSVMLFQGFSLNKTGSKTGDPWLAHPFGRANNVNGVDVAAGGRVDDDQAPTLHSLGNPGILARQEAYVRKVVDTVGDLDNVLYEIINEGGATAWQYHMIDFVRGYERGRAKQHPIGMTHRVAPRMWNAALFASTADWISPADEPMDWILPGSAFVQNYREDPPATDGAKVVVSDTDHLWGHGGNPGWAWKSFLRGMNLLFMDPWAPIGHLERESTGWMFLKGGISKDVPDYPDWEPVRLNLGYIRRYAERVDLARMTPHAELGSTRYCLANPGVEYLFYLPGGGTATLDLRDAAAPLAVEWFIPALGRSLAGPEPLVGGDYAVVTAPYTGDAVLYLKRR